MTTFHGKIFRYLCLFAVAACFLGLTAAPFGTRTASAQSGKKVSELDQLKQQAAQIKNSAGGYKKMGAKQRDQYDALMKRIESISPARARAGRNLPSTFTGSLDGTAPTFNRPITGSNNTTCSLNGGAYNYATFQFTPDCVNQGVAISFESVEGGSFSPAGADTVLFLYGPGGFDPANPCTNLITSDDDGGTGFLSRIVTPQLDPGTYTVVVTAFDSAPGDFPWNFTLGVVCDSGLLPNVNSSVSWTVTGATAGLTPTCTGYADDVTVTGTVTNITQTDLSAITYQVVQMQIPGNNGVFRLVTASDFVSDPSCTGGRVASQQFGPQSLLAGQSTSPTFRITRPTAARFLFFFSVIGDVVTPERVGKRRISSEPMGVEVTTGKDGKLMARALTPIESKALYAQK